MKSSLASDLRIMLCLPALYISADQTRASIPERAAQFCCRAAEVSVTFALRDVGLWGRGGWCGRGVVGRGGTRRGEKKSKMLLAFLGDGATPRHRRRGSGVLTAAQIPPRRRARAEKQKVKGESCVWRSSRGGGRGREGGVSAFNRL